MQSLAVKYRPTVFADVVEQSAVVEILQNQIESGEIQHAYLFCGGAGTGKTTIARIFADAINGGNGNPIEMDAASNSGVDDVRNIGKMAQSSVIGGNYKVFIIDECHVISNTGWQAFLKLIEEPPEQAVFIFCTTDPQKIPKTIMSRVQRFDFQRISQQGIIDRLMLIANEEKEIDDSINWYGEALEYIAKIADGGMRDAITLLEKCLAYGDLTLQNVTDALNVADYDSLFWLLDALVSDRKRDVLTWIDGRYDSGADLKAFVGQFGRFLLDVCKLGIGCPWQYVDIPKFDEYVEFVRNFGAENYEKLERWLDVFVKLGSSLRWSTSVRYDVEAAIWLG